MLFSLCWGYCYNNLTCEAGRGNTGRAERKKVLELSSVPFFLTPAPPLQCLWLQPSRKDGLMGMGGTSHCSHPQKGGVEMEKKSLRHCQQLPLWRKQYLQGGSLFTCAFPALWVWLQLAAISPGLEVLCSLCASCVVTRATVMTRICRCSVATCKIHVQMLLWMVAHSGIVASKMRG